MSRLASEVRETLVSMFVCLLIRATNNQSVHIYIWLCVGFSSSDFEFLGLTASNDRVIPFDTAEAVCYLIKQSLLVVVEGDATSNLVPTRAASR